MIPYPVSPQVELLDASQILEAGDFPTYREHHYLYNIPSDWTVKFSRS
jgi:hypothetical protein